MKTSNDSSSHVVLAGAVLALASLSHGQPANDLFANRALIAGTNVVTTGSTAWATREAGEPYHAGNLGGASAWWSWTAPFSGFVTVSTAGSGIDTLLGIYTGTSVTALTYVASNDDENYSAGIYTSEAYFDVVAGQTYQIAVDGYDGEFGSVRLEILWEPFPLAPAWALPDPWGTLLHSTNYAGKVVILDFWATWCGPCKVELPDFVYLQNTYRGDGLVIIGGSVDATAQAVVSFVATNATRPNYPLIMSDSALENAYGGISAIPTTFIIDRQNIVRKKYVGTQSRSTFETSILPLLYGNTRLSCQRSGSQMLLSWPTNARTFTLEYKPGLANTSWSAWPTLPVVVNGTNTLTVPAAEPPCYFRLRMPY